MEMEGPTNGKEQTHAPEYAGCQLAGKQLCRIRPGYPSGYQVDHDTEICPCSKDNQRPSGLHQTKPCQQVEGGDISSLLSAVETHLCAGLPSTRETGAYWRKSIEGL